MFDNANEGATVIPLTGRGQSERFAAVAEVEAYWHGLRTGESVPYRADLDPRGLERALEDAFILERVGPQVVRFRLAGRHLCDLMGMEVRGMPLTAMFAPERRPSLASSFESLFETPLCLRLCVESPAGVGRPALSGEMTLLPLRSGTGEVARALGCLATEGRLGKAPRRLEVREEHVRPVSKSEPAAPRVGSGFAEPKETFRPAPPKGRPALRLVKSESRSDEE